MNADKLLTLLEQHRVRQANYRLQTERLRSAAREAAQLQAELTPEVDDLATGIMTRPLAELNHVAADELDAAGISLVHFARFVAAKRLAVRLRAECEALAVDLKQSQRLADRLVDYARQQGEVVQL